MRELLTFIGRLDFATFIVIWTLIISLQIFFSLLLFSIHQLRKEAVEMNNRLKKLIDLLSDKKVETRQQ